MSHNHRIETVQLELLRPGPTHGQLLSPLTPYLALCSEDSPVTLNIGLEHWRLLNRLERLRYTRRDGRGGSVRTSEVERESELAELGRDMGQIFAAIPTLGSELGRALGAMAANGGEVGLVHLRLVLSGSELSLLPYELLVSPVGYPGSGHPLLLQPEMRIAITREARKRRGHAPLRWDRKPKILFVSAAPTSSVPEGAHVKALRMALEPWVKWDDDETKRLVHVHEHLTVLTNASIEKIKDACAKGDYTHVHILAHGGEHEESGERRFGLVLCDDLNPRQARVVDGSTVAEALHVRLANTGGHSSPTVVSLATCDSGNVGSVVAPGGSIAYDLHAHGVPWVFASQFPLTKPGSVRMTRWLYESLLWGEDPRLLLEHLRRSLYTGRQDDHDWASLVAYASTPTDLFADVAKFRSNQHQRAINNDRARADLHQEASRAAHDAQRPVDAKAHEDAMESALKSARARIARWTAQLPTGHEPAVRAVRSECFGVAGATEKKIAEHWFKAAKLEDAKAALRESCACYRRAMLEKPDEHWQAAQYLALCAALDNGADHDLWAITSGIAKASAQSATGENEVWAHGTLAELEMLRHYHNPGHRTEDEIIEAIRKHCKHIVELVGWEGRAVASTRQQFQRYIVWWTHERWSKIAAAAVAELTRH